MAHTPQPQIRPTEYMLSKTTILVVDDESGPRESLKMILSPAHKVIAADSGPAALEVMRRQPVDLITIDLQMPGMSGEQLMDAVRRDHPSTEIVIITGNGSMQSAIAGLRYGICDYISKPFDVVEVSGAVSRALDRRKQRSSLVDFLEGVGNVLGKDRDSGELLDELTTSRELRTRLRGSLTGQDAGEPDEPEPDASTAPRAGADVTLEFLDVLAQALENRDGELRKHAQRVGFYADLLAEQLGVAEDLREDIRLSSFLHDIGKVGISEEDRKRAQLRSWPSVGLEEEHPEIGARLVGPLGFPEAVATAIRHHHEHWNGSGFPNGLVGDDIPLAARVIAVVDVFDKLTCTRDGQVPLSSEEALAEIRKQSGARFDPALVLAFVRMIESGHVDVPIDAPAPAPAGAAR